MIGNDDLAKWILLSEDHVAPLLTLEREARFSEDFQTFTAGNGREFGHTATSSASNFSFGTGSLSSSRAAM